MKWKKSSEELKAKFAELISIYPVDKRQMFGYPCAFYNGNMMSGLHQDNIILRLSEEDREALFSKGYSNFEPMKGRKMKEYIAFKETDKDLQKWFTRSFEYVKKLPKKEKSK